MRQNMPYQITIIKKLFTTICAMVRFLVGVSHHMLFQNSSQRKCGVGYHMFFLIYNLGKSLITISAIVRFIFCVCHHVLFQNTSPGKRFTTILASVRCLSGVRHHM